jgi:predicted RNase H-like HicB family nuclease
VNEYVIKIIRDDEAGVWIALSDDIPGLVLEADTYEQLIAEIRGAAPVLIEENIFGQNVITPKPKGYSLRYISDLGIPRMRC